MNLKSDKHIRFLAQAGILVQALPFMQRYQGETIIIKFGGNAMIDEKLFSDFARDIMLLKQVGINPVIVHGGGPQINQMLEKLQIKSEFVAGIRITNKATMDVVAMILGIINKRIVAEINALGGKAIGLSGVDGNLLRAQPISAELGFAGKVAQVDIGILNQLHQHCDTIPVLASFSLGEEDHQFYNVNADVFAGAIAVASKARRLLMLTDIPGVLGTDNKLIRELNLQQAQTLMETGVISGGMIPKLETCIHAVKQGLIAAVILDGRFTHSILLELFTEKGHGTLLRQ